MYFIFSNLCQSDGYDNHTNLQLIYITKSSGLNIFLIPEILRFNHPRINKLPPTGVIQDIDVFPSITSTYKPPQNNNTPIIKAKIADLIQNVGCFNVLNHNIKIACNS